MIIIMAGLPATGKSTLSRVLASWFSGSVLDKDLIRAALFAPADIEYSRVQDDFCMKVMLDTASFTLRKDPQRVNFLDGRPFSRRYQIDQVIETAGILNQPWRIIECVCSIETARKRLQEQAADGSHPAGNRDFELYQRVKADFEEITLPKIVVNTDDALESCVAQAVAALKS
ncbi:MAG: hypothetical protein NVS1B11_00860 [Terriglobales bacterium]